MTGQRIFMDICCGVSRPLSHALLALDCDVFSFDLLLDPSHDILMDAVFEQLLRLAASGTVGYCAASPPCREYSRLKLRPGGPPALRTPEFLQGKPNLTSDQLLRVQESHVVLYRSVQLVQTTYISGGHGHVEQPLSAMSWEEPCVQNFISECFCTCGAFAACQFGADWDKFWLFASTLPDFDSMVALTRQAHTRILQVNLMSMVSSLVDRLPSTRKPYVAPSVT